MYKLYTAPTPNGWKVAMALEELRAQYEVQLIDLQSGEQHSNWFLQINPNGRIPVLKTMGKDSTIKRHPYLFGRKVWPVITN